VYVALIANLLLTLGRKKPTKRTFEMFCLFFMGWRPKKNCKSTSNGSKNNRETLHSKNRADTIEFQGNFCGERWP